MDCLIEERDGVTVVSLKGGLDTGTVGEFQSRTDELLGADVRYFVISLDGVGFIDSAGLGALVRLYKRVRIGEGDVRLARVPPEVMKILKLTRLSRVFEVYPTVEEAAASIKRRG